VHQIGLSKQRLPKSFLNADVMHSETNKLAIMRYFEDSEVRKVCNCLNVLEVTGGHR